MGRWNDQYAGHQIHKTLETLKSSLDREDIPLDQPEISDAINRLKQIRSHISNGLDRLNPEITPLSVLNTINDPLIRTLNEVGNYFNNHNYQHLINANNHIDAALIATSQLPYIRLRKEASSLSEAITHYRSSTENIISDLMEKKNKIFSEYESVNKHSKEVDQRVSELSASIDQQKIRLDSIISDYQRQFSDSEGKRREQFTSQLTNQLNEFTNTQKEIGGKAKEFFDNKRKEADSILETFSNSAKEIIATLEEKRKQASDLVQVIGNIGVTGNFNKIANQERRAANILRIIALILMAGIFGVVFSIVFLTVKEGIDWRLILFRMSAALVLGFPAWYAAHESSIHRKNEIRNRKIELELASIDPYLEKLPDNIKQELKSKLTERFFGRKDDIDIKEEDLPKGIIEIIKLFIQKIPSK